MATPTSDITTVQAEDVREGVRLLTLDRPDRLNAMNHQLVADVHARLDEVDADGDIRCVVFTGAGRGFCAGLDLKDSAAVPGTEYLGRPQAGLATQQHIASLVPHLRSLKVPVIAAVNGPASGGGQPARGRQPPGRHRPREPHADPVVVHGGHAGGDGRLPREAPARVREPLIRASSAAHEDVGHRPRDRSDIVDISSGHTVSGEVA